MYPLKPHRVVCRIGATSPESDSHALTAFEAAQNEGWSAVTPTLSSALWLGEKTASLRTDAPVLQGNGDVPQGADASRDSRGARGRAPS